MPNGAGTAHLLQPKLIAVLREGYGFDTLRRDAVAGATVAVVALPLSMAIAVASGVPPEHGLFTAIVGGFVVSVLVEAAFRSAGPRARSSRSLPRRCSSTAFRARCWRCCCPEWC